MQIHYRLVSRSWQWGLDLGQNEAVCSSKCTCSWETINVKTVNYFTVHQSMLEKREFCSLKRCSINCEWQFLFVPWIYGFGKCALFIYFFRSAEAQQSTARCLTGYSSVVERTGFRHFAQAVVQLSSNIDSGNTHQELDSHSFVVAHSWLRCSSPSLHLWHIYASLRDISYSLLCQLGSLTR